MPLRRMLLCLLAALGLATALAVNSRAAATPPATGPTPSTAERTDALLQALARPVPTRTPFAEHRESALLDEPLLVRGEMSRPQADRLVRAVDTPFLERSEIQGERVSVTRADGHERRFSLRRAPALGVLRDGLSALLSGDAQALRARFDVELAESAGHWHFSLLPSDPGVARHIARLQAFGEGDTLRCLMTQEADGAVSWLLLGEGARDELPDFDGACRLPSPAADGPAPPVGGADSTAAAR